MEQPTVAQKSPFSVNVESGKKYWWCSCGRSKNQPFCDGTHKGSSFSPVMYEATKTETKWFCGCKVTEGKPFCDGSHKSL